MGLDRFLGDGHEIFRGDDLQPPQAFDEPRSFRHPFPGVLFQIGRSVFEGFEEFLKMDEAFLQGFGAPGDGFGTGCEFLGGRRELLGTGGHPG